MPHKDPADRVRWVRRRKATARANLGNRCAVCGFDRNLTILQLDHVERIGGRQSTRNRKDGVFIWSEWCRAARGDAENLQLLCPNCHAEKTQRENQVNIPPKEGNRS